MSVEGLFGWFPQWVVFVVSLALTWASTEFGFRAGSRRRDKLAGEEGDLRPGPFASAALGLASFILALAYGTAQSRLHEVKQVALDESNAIRIAYHQADLMPEADRVEFQELLREYVDLRLQPVDPDAQQEVEQALASSRDLRQAMWRRAVTLAIEEPGGTSRRYVGSVERLIVLYNTRNTVGMQYGLPVSAWLVLYGLTALALTMGGYANGYAGSRRSVVLAFAIALAYSVVLTLVVEIDRTERHLSTISESAMMQLQEDFDRSTGSGSLELPE